jgi:hypothetical protein
METCEKMKNFTPSRQGAKKCHTERLCLLCGFAPLRETPFSSGKFFTRS